MGCYCVNRRNVEIGRGKTRRRQPGRMTDAPRRVHDRSCRLAWVDGLRTLSFPREASPRTDQGQESTSRGCATRPRSWIPACAGMTIQGLREPYCTRASAVMHPSSDHRSDRIDAGRGACYNTPRGVMTMTGGVLPTTSFTDNRMNRLLALRGCGLESMQRCEYY